MQHQGQVFGAIAAPIEAPKKARGTRKPWDPVRMERLLKAHAQTAKIIGQSYVHPKLPNEVPAEAPDSGEWNHVSKTILSWVPQYAELYDDRKKVNSNKKAHNGGLEQHVYLRRDVVNFLNGAGLLTGPLVLRDEKGEPRLDAAGQPITQHVSYQFPTIPEAGGIGIVTRALLTSALVAYVETRGLKHPVEKKYIARDAALQALIGEENFKALATMKPKNAKKKKESAKPKVEKPRIKVLERNGQPVEHLSFDTIPALSTFFILDLSPLAISDEHRAKIAEIRNFLKGLTESRKGARAASAKKDREDKKREKVHESIVPTQIFTLSPNPNFQFPVQPAAGGQPNFQNFVPAVQQQPAFGGGGFQQQQPGGPTAPTGFVPVPGVTFVQPGQVHH